MTKNRLFWHLPGYDYDWLRFGTGITYQIYHCQNTFTKIWLVDTISMGNLLRLFWSISSQITEGKFYSVFRKYTFHNLTKQVITEKKASCFG